VNAIGRERPVKRENMAVFRDCPDRYERQWTGKWSG
jgi:hypothetical protein